MDLMEDGSYTIGGAVYYTGRELQEQGAEVSIVTAYGDDFLFADELKDFSLINLSSAKTTIFQNRYKGEKRNQFLLARADDIVLPDIDYNAYDGIIMCPICREVSESFPTAFSGMCVVAGQGFLRNWKEDGRVIHCSYKFKDYRGADFLVVSEEDIESNELLNLEIDIFNRVIVTRGSSGASAISKNERIDVPAIDVTLVQLTGAGDVFLGGFIYEYLVGKNVEAALRAGCLSAGNHIGHSESI